MILQWLSLQYISKSFSVPFPKLNAFLIFSLHQTEYPPSCIASLIELYGRPDRPPLKLSIVNYIIMFLFFMVIYIFHYRALFCLLLAFLDGVLHTFKDIFSVLPGRFLFFLSGGCYSVVLV